MGHGSGFGKIILFNEHFVVYGIPAIASGIGMITTAEIRKIPNGIDIIDNRKKNTIIKDKDDEGLIYVVKHMLEAMSIPDDGLEVILGGDLLTASGLGSSAALCVAVVKALSDEFGLGLSGEQVNAFAYEGEKCCHGNPSGIDNTVSTFGGLIWYKKGEGLFKRIQTGKRMHMILGNSGHMSNTKDAVEGVKQRREKSPDKFEVIFRDAIDLAENAEKYLVKGDLYKVGALMDRNHALLQEVGVSSPELDFLVNLARKSGALGAKLTGGGMGGFMVALAQDESVQHKVAEAIEREGFRCYLTSIGN